MKNIKFILITQKYSQEKGHLKITQRVSNEERNDMQTRAAIFMSHLRKCFVWICDRFWMCGYGMGPPHSFPTKIQWNEPLGRTRACSAQTWAHHNSGNDSLFRRTIKKSPRKDFFFLFHPKAHPYPKFFRCQIYWRSKYNLRDLISYYLVACVCTTKCQIN